MTHDAIGSWAVLVVFALFGVAFLFAKVDDDQVRKLEALNRFLPAPAVRLYRYRAVRYGVAVIFFILAGVVYINSIASHAT